MMEKPRLDKDGGVYLYRFAKPEGWLYEPGKGAVMSYFRIGEEDLEGVEILLASYDEVWAYDGEAYVLFRKDGKLYEVHGSHCSCYGLEGQWEPEETTLESIEYRLRHGTLGNTSDAHEFSAELHDVVCRLKEDQHE